MGKAVWFPDPKWIEATRLDRWMKQLGFTNYEEFFQASVRDIGWFWGEVEKALGIEWFQPYERVLDLSQGIQWPHWYVGGKINVVHNALEKWSRNPATKEHLALLWEGEDGKTKRYTYSQLAEWVERVAGGLRRLGIGRGDRVTLYLPMIPETVAVMLALSKIGAIFTPAFSGYGAEAVAKRAHASSSKLLVTADGFLRRGKGIRMKEEAELIPSLAPSIEKVLVVRRLGIEIPWVEGRDVDWIEVEKPHEWGESTERMNSEDPFMLLYTSGTTGKPKGTIHIHAGFPIKAAFDAGFAMDLHPEEILFWYTDMGWMMGPFMVFGALLNGAAALLYEGSPDFPAPDRLWEIVEKHRVTHLGVSPTLIRSLMRFEGAEKRHEVRMRVVGSTGEPWNHEPWMWLFQNVLGGKVPIFNYSGGTEISGGILCNLLIKPIAPASFNAPVPGMDVDIYNETGEPVRGEVGELVIKKPWVGMASGFWEEPKRYEEAYFSRWPEVWVHGDWVIQDEEGFWTITGRSDDTLNVAGKRIGPAEVESILVDHESVVEAGVIGVPDEMKGEAMVCFVVVKPGVEPSPSLKEDLIRSIVEQMGKAFKPKELHFIQELPKTRNGKILRRAIRASYLAQEAGDLSALENPAAISEIGGKRQEG
ncbi:Acetyl-coenzyme A synthetase [[Clostridium] ultunense Esp]|nr:Acetyl-coenzyme A synthetase [[Clostridium] ultunense Esp]